MSENKKDKKNKNLNEKEIEKVSGGCRDPRGCDTINYEHSWERKSDLRPAIRYGGICKLDFDKIKEKFPSKVKSAKSFFNIDKDSDKIK